MTSNKIDVYEMHDSLFKDMKMDNVLNKRFLFDNHICRFLDLRTITAKAGLFSCVLKCGMKVNTPPISIVIYTCFEI